MGYDFVLILVDLYHKQCMSGCYMIFTPSCSCFPARFLSPCTYPIVHIPLKLLVLLQDGCIRVRAWRGAVLTVFVLLIHRWNYRRHYYLRSSLIKHTRATAGQMKQQRGNKGEADKKSGGDQQSHMTSDVRSSIYMLIDGNPEGPKVEGFAPKHRPYQLPKMSGQHY